MPKRNGGRRPRLDAVVVGSGPNGLAAAIALAREGFAVRVLEAEATIGGGVRSAELTLPGYVHDVCSAIHPLGVSSPFLRTLPLADHGLEWVHPEAPLAHPFDDGTVALLERSPAATAATLGEDGEAYRALVEPLVAAWGGIAEDILGPPGLPRRPLAVARFGRHALRSALGLAASRFRGPR
ncbi:MAG: NAD(P)/FAD-dependent oxidoreductase, partial [Gemmatimonadetes bacterium]|nr:NAD(P)/FAD-dependent oxidoreductase [Gemmatimonadota bacterium]